MAVRIGFIGTGGIAAAHLVRLVGVPEAEIVGLCDLDHERIEATRDRVNEQVTKAGKGGRLLDAMPYTDYRTMLRQEKLDAAFICLPPFVHGEPEEAVIEAGVHLFVEKPVALDLPLAARTLGKVNRKGLIAASGYQLRYLESMQKAREILAEQTVGMALAMRFGGTPGVPWYHLQNKSGGQLVEQATHHIDQLRYLLGEIKTVYAAGATRINNQNNPEYDVLDVNCMTMTFESGVVANFSNNMISGHGAPATAQGVHIFCDGMTLSHTLGGPLQVKTKEGVEEFSDGADPMLTQDRTFVQAVSELRPDVIKSDYLSGIRSLAVTLAGELSARRHEPVEVMDVLREHAPYVYDLVQ